MEPVTDQTRIAVWQTLCDLERGMRYYGALYDRCYRRNRLLRFALLTGVLVEVFAAFFALTLPWVPYFMVALGALLVVLTLWDAEADYAGHAATLRMTGFICCDLNMETEILWRDIETCAIAPPDAEARLDSILKRWGRATQQVRMSIDDRLNRQVTDAADREIANRYAV